MGFVKKNSNNLNSVGPIWISLSALKTLFSILFNFKSSNINSFATTLGSDLLRTAFIRADNSLKLNGFVI